MSKRGGDFVNKYEVMFIAKPLEEAEVDRWGKRHLAYPVKKQADGYYVLINFEGEPDVIKEIDRVIKIHDTILKHLIVKIDE